MTQIVLAAMLAGYLAVSPALESRPTGKRTHPHTGGCEAVGFEPDFVIPVAAKRVLVLDQPFEPTYAYIRVDNVVYALRLS